jgi:hypothetical protein
MTLRKVERDSMGIPVDDTPSPALRQIRQEKDKNAQARAAMTAGRMRHRVEEIRKAELDQIQREEQARRDLEEHQRRLADEIDREIERTLPNPWLRPWDAGYESPTLIALRQAAELRSASPVDIDAIRQKMHSRLAEIRRRNPSKGAPGRRPVSPSGGRKPFLQQLAEMSPEGVAALPPQKREMRRRWLEGNARYGVRITEANWYPGAESGRNFLPPTLSPGRFESLANAMGYRLPASRLRVWSVRYGA